MGATTILIWVAAMSLITLALLAIGNRLRKRYQAKTIFTLWVAVTVAWMIPVRPSLPFSVSGWFLNVTGTIIPSSSQNQLSSSNPNGDTWVLQAFQRIQSDGITSSTAETWQAWIPFIGPVIVSIWTVGSIIYIARTILQHLRLKRMITTWGQIVDKHEVTNRWRAECRAVGLKKVPRIVRVPMFSSPMVVGVTHPQLLLPQGTDFPTSLVLRHELAHIKRHDTLIQTFFVSVIALQWWNPLLRLAVQQARQNAELACDQIALRSGSASERLEYASSLLDTLKRNTLQIPVGASFLNEKRSITHRLRAILDEPSKKHGWPVALAFFVALVGVGIPVSSTVKITEADGPGLSSVVEATDAASETTAVEQVAMEDAMSSVDTETGSVCPDCDNADGESNGEDSSGDGTGKQTRTRKNREAGNVQMTGFNRGSSHRAGTGTSS